MAVGCADNRNASLMNRLLVITLVGGGLFAHSSIDAIAQVSGRETSAATVIGLSCPYAYREGNDSRLSYKFVIDLQRHKVAQYEDRYGIFHEMNNVRFLDHNISFSYETRGARPPQPEEDLLLRVENDSKIKTTLETSISTSITINRENLSIKIIRRYYDTILDHGDGVCIRIQSTELPPPQF
jgi:hypothetical protein